MWMNDEDIARLSLICLFIGLGIGFGIGYSVFSPDEKEYVTVEGKWWKYTYHVYDFEYIGNDKYRRNNVSSVFTTGTWHDNPVLPEEPIVKSGQIYNLESSFVARINRNGNSEIVNFQNVYEYKAFKVGSTYKFENGRMEGKELYPEDITK